MARRTENNHNLLQIVLLHRASSRYSNLRCLTFKRLHQPTDIRANLDLVPSDTEDLIGGLADWWQMIAFHVTASPVVIVHELRNNVVQVSLAKQDELEKTLVFDGLNESFDPAVQVGRGNGKHVGSDTFGFQSGREILGELRVAIVHHNGRFLFAIHRLIEEHFRLFHHPSGIRMLGGRGHDHFATAQAQKRQQEANHCSIARTSLS